LKDYEVLYGPDGFPYCSSCISEADKTPCYKCGIKLPRSEMQIYKGQYYCQYCFMEVYMDAKDRERREDKKRSDDASKGGEGGMPHHKAVELERCEICGTKLYTVYDVNGMHLCKTCAENMLDDMKRRGEKPHKFAKIKIMEKPISAKIGEIVIQKPKNVVVRAIKKFFRIGEYKYPEIVQVNPKKPMFIVHSQVLEDKWNKPKFTPLTDERKKKRGGK